MLVWDTNTTLPELPLEAAKTHSKIENLSGFEEKPKVLYYKYTS